MTITASNHDAWNATMQGYDDLPATLEELLDRPAWMAQGACRSSGVNFFPELGEQTAARVVCEGCLVREECLAYGIDEHHGVWGGTTPMERRKLRRLRRAA